MPTLYETLGVEKTATDDEIRKAYRKLAKAHHPDLNPGNKQAEQTFKEVAAANAILSDPEKRRRYDAGEIDEQGAEKPPERRFYREYADAGPNFRYGTGDDFGQYEDLGGIFSEMFREGGGPQRGGARLRMRGQDMGFRLPIDFLDAVNGARKRIDLPGDRTLDVTIPPGVETGRVLRLAGMGGPGVNGGPPGDALIEIEVRPHPTFERDGTTIRSVLPITVGEALSGASVRVETVTGPVDLKVPKGSNTGRVMRLRGKGAPDSQGQRGDHLVELRVMLPDPPDADLERLVSEWERAHPYDPRRRTGGAS